MSTIALSHHTDSATHTLPRSPVVGLADAGTLGLDIGGVHIKAAHSSGGAWAVPLAVTHEPDRLPNVLHDLSKQVPRFDRVAVTMTAELCDCFTTKREGVDYVLAAVESLAAGRCVAVWLTDGRFVSPDEARQYPIRCAAGNWHALATYVAERFPSGLSLLVDTGSTTTDIVRLLDGQPDSTGLTDTGRLASGELVYVGAAHTPLSALGPTLRCRGQTYGLMAEPFANTADIFALACDGPVKQQARRHAAARVVRMIGADLEMLTCKDATQLAEAFAQVVYRRVAGGVAAVVEARAVDRVVISGSGGFIAERAAALALPRVPQINLAEQIGADASTAACAYALTRLLDRHLAAARRAAP